MCVLSVVKAFEYICTGFTVFAMQVRQLWQGKANYNKEIPQM